MSIKNPKIILFLILVLALCLRAYHLDSYPPLNPDEAALGYNAYSLLTTGRDEHGAVFPLHFKSFGDYKPGGYVYLDLPFVALMGLTPLAVRLPNLILSITAIFFFYLLVKLLAKNETLSLISAFLLAISPWHIHFSRGAWESSAALSFMIIGTYFLVKYLLKRHLQSYIISLLFLIGSLYIYHSARLIVPLFLTATFVCFAKKFIVDFRHLLLPTFICFLLVLPVLFSFLKNGGTTRLGGVGLTADSGPVWRANELLSQHSPATILVRAEHNKLILYGYSWLEKYLSHFDLNFLFLTGDSVPRSKVPDMGQLYLFALPCILFGLYQLFNQKNTLQTYFVLSWLALTPIASSLTFQAPSALRSLSLVIPLTYLTALGLNSILKYIPNLWPKILIYFLIIFSLGYYFDAYFTHYQHRYPDSWSAPFDQLVTYLQEPSSTAANIYITNHYDQPYIEYLFFSRYPAAKLQPQIKLTSPDNYGFSTVATIDNLHFGDISSQASYPSGSLIVAADQDLPFGLIDTIYFPNGAVAFKIYRN